MCLAELTKPQAAKASVMMFLLVSFAETGWSNLGIKGSGRHGRPFFLHSKFRFLCFLLKFFHLRLYLLNFASVSSTDDFDSSLTVFTGAGFVASGVALWNIAVVEPLGQRS